ncbi:MAG TPA: hypothetical protein VIG24_17780 [Acidimicrobiia bacterium]
MSLETLSGVGATLAIGTTTAAAIASEFEADTYQEIGQLGDISELSEERAAATFTGLKDGRTVTARGSKSVAPVTINYALKSSGDDGYDDLVTAYAAPPGSDEFNFRVMLDDQITPSTGNPTTFYFRAKVMKHPVSIGGVDADGTVMRQTVLAINTQILEVAAV